MMESCSGLLTSGSGLMTADFHEFGVVLESIEFEDPRYDAVWSRSFSRIDQIK